MTQDRYALFPIKILQTLFVAFILFSLITACGQQQPVVSPNQVPPTVPPEPAMTSSPVPAPTKVTPSPLPPTETLAPSPTSFVPKATIKIASQSPLSVQFVDMGTDIMRSADLAVSQLATPLVELGYKVELAPYDDQNDFSVAVDVAKQITADPEILCVVGPFGSRVLNQVKEIYHQTNLPFISPSATAAFVADSGYLEVNRVVGRHDGQGAVGAQFANEQGFSRVFIVSQTSDFAQFNAYHFQNEAVRLGIEIVGDMSTDAAKDFGWIVDRVKAADADLVYFSTLSVDQAGAFFREARAAGYMGAFLGNEGINDPALLELAGPLLIEGGGMYYTAITASASYYPGAANFLEDFETLYGAIPQMFAAHAYDAAGICLEAIEEASKAKDGEIPTRAEVAKAIRTLQDYQGITGVYRFDVNGDPDPAQYFVFQVVSVVPGDWSQNVLVATFEVSPPE